MIRARIGPDGSTVIIDLVLLHERAGVADRGRIATVEELDRTNAMFAVLSEAVPAGSPIVDVVNACALIIAGALVRKGIPLAFIAATIAQLVEQEAEAGDQDAQAAVELAALVTRLANLNPIEHGNFVSSLLPMDRAGLMTLAAFADQIAAVACGARCPTCVARDTRERIAQAEAELAGREVQ